MKIRDFTYCENKLKQGKPCTKQWVVFIPNQSFVPCLDSYVWYRLRSGYEGYDIVVTLQWSDIGLATISQYCVDDEEYNSRTDRSWRTQNSVSDYQRRKLRETKPSLGPHEKEFTFVGVHKATLYPILCEFVDKCGSVESAAWKLKISKSYIYSALRRDCVVGDRLAKALGYRNVNLYTKASNIQENF